MKILVAIKRVVDANVRVRVKADGTGIETANVKMSMNPFDENAIEEAVRLKEAGHATEIVAVSIGPEQAQDTLRIALAMGADRAILIKCDEAAEPLAVAKTLAKVVAEEQPSLVLLGKQAIDDDCSQTGQMLSALLGWGQVAFASKVTLVGDKLEVTREVDAGQQVLETNLPAVLTCDLNLNEPRKASLPNVMKARSKPLAVKSIADYGVDPAPRLKVLGVEAPAPRKAGIMVGSAAELVDKLKTEAGVL